MTQPAASMPNARSILCVLSEAQAHEFEADLAQLRGPNVETIVMSSPEEALSEVGKVNPLLIVAGMDLGEMEGLEFLALLMQRYPDFSGKVVVLPDRNDPFPPVLQYRDRATGRSVTEQTQWNAVIGLARSLGTRPEPAATPLRAVAPSPVSPAVSIDVQSIDEWNRALEASIPPPGRGAQARRAPLPPAATPSPISATAATVAAIAVPALPATPTTPASPKAPPLEASSADALEIAVEPEPQFEPGPEPEPEPELAEVPSFIPRRAPRRGLLVASLVVAAVAVASVVALRLQANDQAQAKPARPSPEAAGPTHEAAPLAPQAAQTADPSHQPVPLAPQPALAADRAEVQPPPVQAKPAPPEPVAAPSSQTPGTYDLSKAVTLPLRFSKGEATFAVSDQTELAELVAAVASALNAEPRARLEVGGHTSREGSGPQNKRLGLRRAAEVQRYLVEHGTRADRVRLKSYGEQTKLADDERGLPPAKLRRVTVKLLR